MSDYGNDSFASSVPDSPAKADGGSPRRSSRGSSRRSSNGNNGARGSNHSSNTPSRANSQQRRARSRSRSRTPSRHSDGGGSERRESNSRDDRRGSRSPSGGSRRGSVDGDDAPAAAVNGNVTSKGDEKEQEGSSLRKGGGDDEEEADAAVLAATPVDPPREAKLPGKSGAADGVGADRRSRSRSHSGGSGSSSSRNGRNSRSHSAAASSNGGDERGSRTPSRRTSSARSRSAASSAANSDNSRRRSSAAASSAAASSSPRRRSRSRSHSAASSRSHSAASSRSHSGGRRRSGRSSRSSSGRSSTDGKVHHHHHHHSVEGGDEGGANADDNTTINNKADHGDGADDAAEEGSTTMKRRSPKAPTPPPSKPPPPSSSRKSNTTNNNNTNTTTNKKKKGVSAKSSAATSTATPPAYAPMHTRNLLSDAQVATIRAYVEATDAQSAQKGRLREKQRDLQSSIDHYGKVSVAVPMGCGASNAQGLGGGADSSVVGGATSMSAASSSQASFFSSPTAANANKTNNNSNNSTTLGTRVVLSPAYYSLPHIATAASVKQQRRHAEMTFAAATAERKASNVGYLDSRLNGGASARSSSRREPQLSFMSSSGVHNKRGGGGGDGYHGTGNGSRMRPLSSSQIQAGRVGSNMIVDSPTSASSPRSRPSTTTMHGNNGGPHPPNSPYHAKNIPAHRSPYLSKGVPLTTFDTLYMPTKPPSDVVPLSPERVPAPRSRHIISMSKTTDDGVGYRIVTAVPSPPKAPSPSRREERRRREEAEAQQQRSSDGDEGSGGAEHNKNSTSTFVGKSSADNPHSPHRRHDADGTHFSRRPAAAATTAHDEDDEGGEGDGGGSEARRLKASPNRRGRSTARSKAKAKAGGAADADRLADDEGEDGSDDVHTMKRQGTGGDAKKDGGEKEDHHPKYGPLWTLECSLLTLTYAKVLARSEEYGRRQLLDEQRGRRSALKAAHDKALAELTQRFRKLRDLEGDEERLRSETVSAQEASAWSRLCEQFSTAAATAKGQEEVFPMCPVLSTVGSKQIITGAAHGSFLVEVRWSGTAGDTVVPVVLMYSRDNRLCLCAAGDEILRCPKSGLPVMRPWGEFRFRGNNTLGGAPSTSAQKGRASQKKTGGGKRKKKKSSSSSASSSESDGGGSNSDDASESGDEAEGGGSQQQNEGGVANSSAAATSNNLQTCFELLLHNLAPSLGVRKVFIALLPPAKNGASLGYLRRAYLTIRTPSSSSSSSAQKPSPITRLVPDTILNEFCAISIGDVTAGGAPTRRLRGSGSASSPSSPHPPPPPHASSPLASAAGRGGDDGHPCGGLVVASIVAGPATERHVIDHVLVAQLTQQYQKHQLRAGVDADSSSMGSIAAIVASVNEETREEDRQREKLERAEEQQRKAEKEKERAAEEAAREKERREEDAANGKDGDGSSRASSRKSSRASSHPSSRASSRASSPSPPSSPQKEGEGRGEGVSEKRAASSSPQKQQPQQKDQIVGRHAQQLAVAAAHAASQSLADAVVTFPWALVNVLKPIADGSVVSQRVLPKRIEAMYSMMGVKGLGVQFNADLSRILQQDLGFWEKCFREQCVAVLEPYERRALMAEMHSESENIKLAAARSLGGASGGGDGFLGAPSGGGGSSSSYPSRRVSYMPGVTK